MGPLKDYYTILGLRRGATAEEITAAHLALARKYHPDVNPDDPQAAEHFKEVQHAFEVLSDPAQRAAYDQTPISFSTSYPPADGAAETLPEVNYRALWKPRPKDWELFGCAIVTVAFLCVGLLYFLALASFLAGGSPVE